MRGLPKLTYLKVWAGAVVGQPSGQDKSSKPLGGQDHVSGVVRAED